MNFLCLTFIFSVCSNWLHFLFHPNNATMSNRYMLLTLFSSNFFFQSRVSKIEKCAIVFSLTTFSPLLSIHSKESAQRYTLCTAAEGLVMKVTHSYTGKSYWRTFPASVYIVLIPHVSFPSPPATLLPFLLLPSFPSTFLSVHFKPLTLVRSKTALGEPWRWLKSIFNSWFPRVLISSAAQDVSISLCRVCWKLTRDTSKETSSWKCFAFSSGLATCCWLSGDKLLFLSPITSVHQLPIVTSVWR